MIVLKYALPLVRNTHGVAALERTWLRIAIQEAADRAGYDGWWLVDDLVAGISLYLRNCYFNTVIDLSELEGMVRAALRSIGYEEVAAHFCSVQPARKISLLHCLQPAPAATHAGFFKKLAKVIKHLCGEEVRHFHFYDLRACVDQLERADAEDRLPWQECLRERIVTFVRRNIHSLAWAHEVSCSIT